MHTTCAHTWIDRTGDIIIAVDHEAATSENVSTLLVGNDEPGERPNF